MRRSLKACLQRTFVASALVFISISALSQEPKVLTPHRPFSPKVKRPYPLPPGVPGSMVGGPWIVDANFKSAVYIKNGVETSPITVTPVLYLSNGVSQQLPDVRLEPSGTSILDIGAALQTLGIAPYATLSGYIELKYNWPWDPICATIRNLDTTHSLIFNYGLHSSKPPDLPGAGEPSISRTSRVVEGLWWKQEAHVTGFVALANTTSQAVNVSIELSNDTGASLSKQTARISPHGSKTLDLFDLSSARTSVGGIRITYTGTATDLLVNGGLEDIGSGYSANIPFTSAPASKGRSTATVAELGLMTGPADPMMHFPSGTAFTPYTVLRNVSTSSIRATPTLWWMASGSAHSALLSAVNLASHQSQVLDFPALLAQAGLKDFFGNVQLAFKVEGNTGGLLMAGGSVDKANTYVFEVAPHGITESASKTLSYWNIADGDDTMVTLWNPADEAQDFIFQLTYSRGHYGYPIHLDARATRTFNISEIVESGIPDAEGDVVPDGIQHGGAKITGSHADNEHILVAIDAGTYNVRKATCGQYCQTCDGVTAGSVADNPFSVGVAQQHQLTFYATWNTGSQYNVSSFGHWTTSASPVATVGTMGSGTPGLVAGVSAGSSTITAQYAASNEPNYQSYWCEGSSWSCPISYWNGQGSSPGTVQKPTYFFSPSAVTVQGGCYSPSFGSFYNVSYYVADQSSNRINTAGMTPLENAPGTNGNYNAFALPSTTSSTGSFNDNPVGTCFTGLPQGHQTCVATFTVTYQDTLGSTKFPISTSTVRRDCSLGNRIQIQGNPSAQNKTYSQGTVN